MKIETKVYQCKAVKGFTFGFEFLWDHTTQFACVSRLLHEDGVDVCLAKSRRCETLGEALTWAGPILSDMQAWAEGPQVLEDLWAIADKYSVTHATEQGATT